ncbi:hypothetical protein PBOI14_74160 [Pseudomonas sp. Boi14]|nr:hypothetical protein PBOI14_74160 [Pseudomonas sp. Boi14]
MGSVIERLGTRRVLVTSIAVLSLLSGFSALATGVLGLVILRGLMGICEGAFTPPASLSPMKSRAPTGAG